MGVVLTDDLSLNFIVIEDLIVFCYIVKLPRISLLLKTDLIKLVNYLLLLKVIR